MAELLTAPSLQAPAQNANNAAYALARVRDALSGLRYGAVTVIVQDGVVVQVERTEKLRLPRRGYGEGEGPREG